MTRTKPPAQHAQDHALLEPSALVIHFYAFLFFIGIPSSYLIAVYVFFFTRYYWIVVAYLTFCYGERGIEERGGRQWKPLRQWRLWNCGRDYFPAKLIKTGDFIAGKNHLVCVHPHGIACGAAIINFGSITNDIDNLYPHHDIVGLTLKMSFRIPLIRELVLWAGGCSVSRESMNFLLSDPSGRRFVAIAPGGTAEAILSRPGSNEVVLKNRKGFVEMAIRNGTYLVPAYSFGETDLFEQVPYPDGSWVRRVQDYFHKTFGIVPPIIRGSGPLGIMPLRRPLTTVVGSPIEVEKISEPTNEQINKVHTQFVISLQTLFEEHKHKYLDNADEKFLIIS